MRRQLRWPSRQAARRSRDTPTPPPPRGGFSRQASRLGVSGKRNSRFRCLSREGGDLRTVPQKGRPRKNCQRKAVCPSLLKPQTGNTQRWHTTTTCQVKVTSCCRWSVCRNRINLSFRGSASRDFCIQRSVPSPPFLWCKQTLGITVFLEISILDVQFSRLNWQLPKK